MEATWHISQGSLSVHWRVIDVICFSLDSNKLKYDGGICQDYMVARKLETYFLDHCRHVHVYCQESTNVLLLLEKYPQSYWPKLLKLLWGSSNARYVGVIRFLFHVPPIRLTQQNVCCVNKSMLGQKHKSDWNSDLFLAMDIGSAFFNWKRMVTIMFSQLFSLYPPNYVHYWMSSWYNLNNQTTPIYLVTFSNLYILLSRIYPDSLSW